jgi:hypothetical protein
MQHYVCHPVLFILVTCRTQFDFYLLSFSSYGFCFRSSKISSFLCGQKGRTILLLWKLSSRFMSIVHIFVWGFKFHFYIENMESQWIMYLYLYSWIFLYPHLLYRPASWSSGQSFWLLILRSRIRFPVLPWVFFREGWRVPWWPWSG